MYQYTGLRSEEEEMQEIVAKDPHLFACIEQEIVAKDPDLLRLEHSLACENTATQNVAILPEVGGFERGGDLFESAYVSLISGDMHWGNDSMKSDGKSMVKWHKGKSLSDAGTCALRGNAKVVNQLHLVQTPPRLSSHTQQLHTARTHTQSLASTVQLQRNQQSQQTSRMSSVHTPYTPAPESVSPQLQYHMQNIQQAPRLSPHVQRQCTQLQRQLHQQPLLHEQVQHTKQYDTPLHHLQEPVVRLTERNLSTHVLMQRKQSDTDSGLSGGEDTGAAQRASLEYTQHSADMSTIDANASAGFTSPPHDNIAVSGGKFGVDGMEEGGAGDEASEGGGSVSQRIAAFGGGSSLLHADAQVASTAHSLVQMCADEYAEALTGTHEVKQRNTHVDAQCDKVGGEEEGVANAHGNRSSYPVLSAVENGSFKSEHSDGHERGEGEGEEGREIPGDRYVSVEPNREKSVSFGDKVCIR